MSSGKLDNGVTDLEQTYHELVRIRREVDHLASFLLSRMPSRTCEEFAGMIDPRTNKRFERKSPAARIVRRPDKDTPMEWRRIGGSREGEE